MDRPDLVAAAQLQGIADAYSQHRRITAREARAELTEVLARVPEHRRQATLNYAAARYAQPGGIENWYYPRSFAVLVRAGASRERAREIRAARPTGRGLAGLGEQAGRLNT